MTESVRAVDRALDILSSFTLEKPVLSLTDIAESIGISKSTVHRLLGTLETRRFIIRDFESGKYHLGYRFLEMTSQAFDDINHQWALPYLQRLCDDCGETVDLAILDGSDVVYLQVVESPQRVKIAAAMGQRLPAFCTATGKAFLAFIPQEEVKRILSADLKKFTESTHTDQEAIHYELIEIRQRGFSISMEEYEKDINAVAVPILAEDGYPLAAIAVAGPSYRLTRERMLSLGPAIQQCIESMTRDVGLVVLSSMIPRNVHVVNPI